MECTLCEIKEGVKELQKQLDGFEQPPHEVIPLCFHCGRPYLVDEKYCGPLHTTWKPGCTCLNKPTIRIVTGSENEYQEAGY